MRFSKKNASLRRRLFEVHGIAMNELIPFAFERRVDDVYLSAASPGDLRQCHETWKKR